MKLLKIRCLDSLCFGLSYFYPVLEFKKYSSPDEDDNNVEDLPLEISDDIMINIVERMCEEIKKNFLNLQENITVYRGEGSNEHKILEEIKIKQSGIAKTFISTSYDISYAKAFQGKNGTLFKIYVSKGSKYIDVNKILTSSTRYSREQEVILFGNLIEFDSENIIIKPNESKD